MNVHQRPDKAAEKATKKAEKHEAAAAAPGPSAGRREQDAAAAGIHAEVSRGRKAQGQGRVITGGDCGIGRAVAVAMAREGALISILYLDEHDDANETKRLVEAEGSQCLLFAGDVGDEMFCWESVERVNEEFGRIDILVNNAAEQHEVDDPADLDTEQLERTFRTNVFSFFHMTRACLQYMQAGASIINTTSITAYRGPQDADRLRRPPRARSWRSRARCRRRWSRRASA